MFKRLNGKFAVADFTAGDTEIAEYTRVIGHTTGQFLQCIRGFSPSLRFKQNATDLSQRSDIIWFQTAGFGKRDERTVDVATQFGDSARTVRDCDTVSASKLASSLPTTDPGFCTDAARCHKTDPFHPVNPK